MLKLVTISSDNNKEDNKKWPYRMLIIGPSGSRKSNALLNVIQWSGIQKQDNDNLIEKIYLYMLKT